MAMPNAILTKVKPITLPPLPWADNALEPVISKNTIGFHYGKHHKTYVDNAEQAHRRASPRRTMPLEEIVRRTVGKPDRRWRSSTTPRRCGTTRSTGTACSRRAAAKPPRELAEKIESSFGGYDAFKKKFADAAVTQFGSGWAWLVAEDGKLKVVADSRRRGPRSPRARRRCSRSTSGSTPTTSTTRTAGRTTSSRPSTAS